MVIVIKFYKIGNGFSTMEDTIFKKEVDEICVELNKIYFNQTLD